MKDIKGTEEADQLKSMISKAYGKREKDQQVRQIYETMLQAQLNNDNSIFNGKKFKVKRFILK